MPRIRMLAVVSELFIRFVHVKASCLDCVKLLIKIMDLCPRPHLLYKWPSRRSASYMQISAGSIRHYNVTPGPEVNTL